MKQAKEIRPIEVLVSARWLTMAEACYYACKSENTLKKIINEGKIYADKKGGGWIVDRESIDTYYNETRDNRRIELDKILRRRKLFGG
jgi:hypothetical protein